jgi:hypothetical protein
MDIICSLARVEDGVGFSVYHTCSRKLCIGEGSILEWGLDDMLFVWIVSIS